MENFAGKNNGQINDLTKEVRRILKISAQNVAREIKKYEARQKLTPDKYGKQLARSKALRTAINKNFDIVEKKIVDAMTLNLPLAWDLANEKNNNIASKYSTKKQFYQTNDKALEAFINRKVAGFNWSERVHVLNELNKQLYFDYIATGITQGRSVDSIARDLNKVNTNPLDVDVFDENGNKRKFASVSNTLAGGGYKNPFANYRRLVRTEMKNAFHKSDFLRVQQLDFIVGIEVKLSAAHEIFDICDHMKGMYPKTFQFSCWHPNCLCYSTTILKTKEEFRNDVLKSKNEVSTIPLEAKKYVKTNSDKLQKQDWFKYNFK